MVAARCSTLPPEKNAAEPVAQPAYGALVANTVKGFKPFAGYSNFEISGLRWVAAETGRNWLACLRYRDHGQLRFYSFFIANNAVVNARYAVVTDRCGAQQYVPFDITTGTVGSPTPVKLQPLH